MNDKNNEETTRKKSGESTKKNGETTMKKGGESTKKNGETTESLGSLATQAFLTPHQEVHWVWMSPISR